MITVHSATDVHFYSCISSEEFWKKEKIVNLWKERQKEEKKSKIKEKNQSSLRGNGKVREIIGRRKRDKEKKSWVNLSQPVMLRLVSRCLNLSIPS